ncbi:putative adherance factor [Phytophthora cinnamomi]|nr:putative adherance factor [Phytophthora cinnamomi]
MEELTRMAANHVGEDNIRDSTSTLGGLHDSSISLSSGNHFGDSTISSISSASSVDIDDVDFDFETRPLGRTKRSGTIPFALENLDQVPDVEDEEQSEGPDDSETSFCMSEGAMENEDDNELGDDKQAYHEGKESVDQIRPSEPKRSYSPREKSMKQERTDAQGVTDSSYRFSDESAEHDRSSVSDGVDSSYRMSEESVEQGHEQEDVKSASRVSEPSFDRESDQVRAASPFNNNSRERKSEQEKAESAYQSSVESESEPEDADAAYRMSGEPVTPAKSPKSQTIAEFTDDRSRPGRSLHPNFGDEDEQMQWRSSDVMGEVESKHTADMERLRRRIRQLEEECRESIASVLTPDEMDLSELDHEEDFNGHQSYHGGRNFNPQSSFMSASDLSASIISEQAEEEEPMPARILLEQIAKLTQLQQDMAEVDDDDDDEEEYRERIKDQYRALRSIQSETQRERRSSSLSQRSSVSEENWI